MQIKTLVGLLQHTDYVLLFAYDHLGTSTPEYAELQLTTLYYNRPHPAPQILPKTSNLTAVSYGQTRWAVSAAFGQQKSHSGCFRNQSDYI